MIGSKESLTEWLPKTGLFRGLTEEHLDQIAARLAVFRLEAGALLYAAGDRADNFYLLESGELQSWYPGEEEAERVATLNPGDFFGDHALLNGNPRQMSVSASRDSAVLYMPRKDFEWMLEAFPELADRLEWSAHSHEEQHEIHFDWLRNDESVHLVARKHSAYLWMRLIRAMITSIVGLLAVYTAIGTPIPEDASRWAAIGAGLLVLAILWAIWEYMDWRNDFYILTDLRVVWLEQVLLRSSSRKEAPLQSIQSVNIHTSMLGRWMGFGDIVVRTYTGTVLMPVVAQPEQVKHLIEQHVDQLRKQNRSEKHENIRLVVRESLGHPAEKGLDAAKASEPLEIIDNEPRFQLFKTRQVKGVEVTYHKHWFVLFGSLILPAFFFTAVLYVLNILYGGLPPTSTDWLIAVGFAGLPLAVIVYRYFDWQNDIYRVTADSLIDSEKKPLGSEVTKSAPLANVLSLENHRVGLVGLLLNFGVVRINVGDSSLEFVDVHDPVQIQHDIFIRMQALKSSERERQEEEERRRMAEWLKVYDEERGGTNAS
ncbi:MAG: cyclic nucleotide-binding domain-containing protein [Chloroflexi bacterium]|nr:cyclic nucleotide-binding domain-containing protein [Chloroflexota bacterium]